MVPDPYDLECVPVTCVEQDVANAYIIQLTGKYPGSKATYRSEDVFVEFHLNQYIIMSICQAGFFFWVMVGHRQRFLDNCWSLTDVLHVVKA